jgi:hypothetical protein
MRQGITVPDLGADTLITGYHTDHLIWSCSAVMFFNTTTRAAGLYHFPAGNILTDGDSRNALTDIKKAVQPNEAYIAYGVVTLGYGPPKIVPSDEYSPELHTFVLGLLPLECRLRQLPARNGFASIGQAGNRAVIGTTNPGTAITDLSDFAAGNYAFGRIYK